MIDRCNLPARFSSGIDKYPIPPSHQHQLLRPPSARPISNQSQSRAPDRLANLGQVAAAVGAGVGVVVHGGSGFCGEDAFEEVGRPNDEFAAGDGLDSWHVVYS
jgi:hypothetical protein